MIAGNFVPPELVAGALSAAIIAIIFLAVALSKMSERITRLEEWVRVWERLNGKNRE